MDRTILVTGGSGYVAGWCILGLLERGCTVRATLRNLAKAPQLRASIATLTDPGDRLSFVQADLLSDAGWDEAVSGCEAVLHVASPLGNEAPKHPDELIVPARDGSLRVLRAATRAGIRRVVMTSSCAAASPPLSMPDGTSDERIWTDPDQPGLSAYRRSKTLAERAAWEFMAAQDGPTRLTTILPGGVLGPVLTTEALGSVQVVQRLLQGRMPGVPRIGFNVVDVRDVADLHLIAMDAAQAEGQRYLAAGAFMTMREMAALLRARLGADAARVPRWPLPDVAFRVMAAFVPALRSVKPNLGRRHSYDANKARRELGWRPRPAEETVLDCAKSLIAHRAA